MDPCHILKHFAFALLFPLLVGVSASARAEAPEVVTVGAYPFAPYLEVGADGQLTGMAVAFWRSLNQLQSEYRFELVLTSPKRRYQDFEEKAFDLIAFENINWGWKQRSLSVDFSKVFLTDAEVYISRKDTALDPNLFETLTSKDLVGILGYHYGFADFEADADALMQRFSIYLTQSNAGSIHMILHGRGEVGVVTRSYLNLFLRRHPVYQEQLRISEEVDQLYQHTVLVRENHRISVEKINHWLNELKEKGTLGELAKTYGVQ